ncbi:MAG: deoxyguanosinetriphosphate triphosphohydrolase [Kiritimatiellae bacterium]|nr:deoxyguanosinetriphosphate triphosphohydrolase [Kiritimatiellia bacterium]
MILGRTEHEAAEAQRLAPWAARSAQSRGRVYPQPAHDLRSEFQRDRDRILHSRPFRRLEYKTQVFVNGTADHYRTRLTHTIEVAAVARTIARCLGANEDLAEAIALAHDVGHSPFGHSGEAALDELMRDWGGFDHNDQSCRALELIELQYPGFAGLNLTWEVRAGLRKHRAASAEPLDGYPIGPQPMIEAQIADVADDVTYHAHDVDDALEAGLIGEDDLRELEIWRRAEARARAQGAGEPDDRLRRLAVRNLLDIQVEDVIRTSAQRLEKERPDSVEAVMSASRRMVDGSEELRAMVAPLHAFLFQRVYFHPAVARANEEAVRLMRRLFMHYLEHPETMGRKARARIATEGLWRTVCDYIAGMTDRYALEEYQRFGLDAGRPA